MINSFWYIHSIRVNNIDDKQTLTSALDGSCRKSQCLGYEIPMHDSMSSNFRKCCGTYHRINSVIIKVINNF